MPVAYFTPYPPASRCRSLFAVAGAAITAAAASVADLAERPPNPDAELISLCAQFDALEQRRQEVCDSARTVEEDEAADVIWAELYKRQQPLLERMCAIPAITAEGMAALAGSLKLWDGELFDDVDDPDACANERLLAALLRSLLAERA